MQIRIELLAAQCSISIEMRKSECDLDSFSGVQAGECFCARLYISEVPKSKCAFERCTPHRAYLGRNRTKFSAGQAGADTRFPMQVERYEFLPGMPELLQQLQGQGTEMHVISNYPEWYRLIEDKLQISQYLPWTFISCSGPMKVI